MISRFTQNSKLEELSRWLSSIDYQDAEVLKIEQSIYAALVASQKQSRWNYAPIAPLAEPVNLNELVGTQFSQALDELIFQASRLDNDFTWLNETNNLLKISMESVEKAVASASDSLQDITILKGQDSEFYYWVADSFNNTTFIDKDKTTALVDTDYGIVSLGPTSLQSVGNFQPVIDTDETQGIPGCNLMIIDRGDPGSPQREPNPLFEGANNKDFSNIFDNDSSTWFEVERNFIPPKQKCVQFGRAWVHNSSGQEIDVKTVTADLDWKAEVLWFNKAVPMTGPDGKGIYMAEFRDIGTDANTNSQVVQQTPNTRHVFGFDVPLTNTTPLPTDQSQFGQTVYKDNDATLVFNIVLLGQIPLSFISLLPLIRGSQPVMIDSIKAFSDDLVIQIAENVEISPSNNSTTLLNRETLRRTGAQSVGGMYSIPTNRPIQRIEVRLRSKPEKIPFGFGHPFQEKLEATRTEQHVIFFSIVSHSEDWIRIPFSDKPRQITSTFTQSRLLGSLASDLGTVLNLAGQVQQRLDLVNRANSSIQKSVGSILTELGQVNAAAKILNAGSVFGKVGASIGKALGVVGSALGVIGGVIAAVDLVQSLFAFEKTVEIKEVRTGVDVFDGYRAAIGIRDLSLIQVNYQDTSVIQSVKRVFQGKVKKIGLFAEEKIPDEWGPGNWIEYFISTDGATWHNLPKVADVSIDGGFTPDQPTDTVYFRAILHGNANDPSTSPFLRHFALQGLPA